MEEEKIIEETEFVERPEDVELQTTFNEDGLDVLVEDGQVENIDRELDEETEGIGAVGDFTMRTTRPTGGRFFNNGNNGGSSWCINGSPTDSRCNVLSNCVGYACGRFNEIIGSMKYPQLCCNAENFIERAKQYGLEISDVPTLGGIMVWQKGATLKGSDGAGHVESVERIDSPNQIYTSASNWGGTTFYNAIRNNSNGRWGLGSGYTFRGCIVNPAIGKITSPTSTNNQNNSNGYTGKFKVGDKVIIDGALYVSSTASSPSGSVSNKETIITRVAQNTAHPYNTTGDLGWMNETDIKLVSTPALTQPSTPSQSNSDLLTIVKRTIRGDFGNQPERQKKIEALGYNYEEVRKQVNLNYQHNTTRWDNIKLY